MSAPAPLPAGLVACEEWDAAGAPLLDAASAEALVLRTPSVSLRVNGDEAGGPGTLFVTTRRDAGTSAGSDGDTRGAPEPAAARAPASLLAPVVVWSGFLTSPARPAWRWRSRTW